MENFIGSSLIVAIITPCRLWILYYFSATSFAMTFSFFLVNNGSNSSPLVRIPIIQAISWVSISIGSSSHKKPPLAQLSKILTQMLTSKLLPKCGIFRRFRMLDFSSLMAHYCISMTTSWPDHPTLIAYFFVVNSRNFFKSCRSWSLYLSLSAIPVIFPSWITPFEIGVIKSLYFGSLGKWTLDFVTNCGGGTPRAPWVLYSLGI